MLDNIEIRNGSQTDTSKSSIRFEGASGPGSSVSNVSIHNGLSWGISIIESANIFIGDSTMFRHQAFGIQIMTSRNVTIDGNVLAAILPRVTLIDPFTKTIDKGAGMAVCSFKLGDMCSDIFIKNNIVAGADYAAFVAPAHDCGDTKQKKLRQQHWSLCMGSSRISWNGW